LEIKVHAKSACDGCLPCLLEEVSRLECRLRAEQGYKDHVAILSAYASREGADPHQPHLCRQDPAIPPVAVQPRNNHLTGVHLMVCISTGVHLKGVYLMGMHFIGVYLMGVHLTGVHLMGIHFIRMHLVGVHLTGMCPMGVYLTGVHLMGVYLTNMHPTGVYLMGVHLIDVYFIDVYMFPNPKRLRGKPPDPPPYKWWSIC
jgi:uncharacterized protein YjbI with pentapeptide repeats